MIINHASVMVHQYSCSFHSQQAADEFAAELRAREGIYEVTVVRTNVVFVIKEPIGDTLGKDFEARWIKRLANTEIRELEPQLPTIEFQEAESAASDTEILEAKKVEVALSAKSAVESKSSE